MTAGRHIARTRAVALAGVAIISTSAILVRLAGRTPITAAFFRMAYAAPALMVLSMLLGRGRRRSARSSGLALAAGAALACDLFTWHNAIAKIGAGLATVVANTQVPFVGLAAWILHRERPHARAFAAVPLVFAGVALISGLGTAGTYGVDPVGGTLLGLAAGIAYSVFLLVLRASGRDGSHPVVPLFEATVSAAVCALLIGALTGDLDLRITWPAHGWLMLLGIGCTVVGWTLISHALTKLPALETSIMLMLQPMLTMLIAAPVFGEWISAIQWGGAAMVVSGVGYLSIRGAVREEAPGRAALPEGTAAAIPPLETPGTASEGEPA